MKDYTEWLRSFDQDDHGKAAEAALDDLGRLSSRARDLLHPILTEAILMERRANVRQIERQLPTREVFEGETTIEQRQRWLDQKIALDDGRTVIKSEATYEDWQLRIRLLDRHRIGIERSIAEAEEAIELIRSHGVSCLGEIGVAA